MFSLKKGETLLSFVNFYLSQAIIYYYTDTVPQETFFKFVQVGMEHHYDNVRINPRVLFSRLFKILIYFSFKVISLYFLVSQLVSGTTFNALLLMRISFSIFEGSLSRMSSVLQSLTSNFAVIT